MRNMFAKSRRARLLWMASAAVLAGGISTISVRADAQNGWNEEDGNWYWYENGVKQGLEGRGKEIYDPGSDGWYWLDAVDGGRKAVGKDVYQESDAGEWADREDGTGKWSRYDADGRMVKGWSTNENGTYFFDYKYGAMAKGWTTSVEDRLRYFDIGTGIMARGSVVVDGKLCYFEEDGTAADKKWVSMDGSEFWYEQGVRQGLEGRGKEIYDPGSGAWYWLDSVDQGKKAVSKDVYQESEADDAGNIGKWVRYDAEGHMIKGWDTNENGTYYFDPVYGTMARGIVEIEGKTWIFDDSTGILQVEEEGKVTERQAYAAMIALKEEYPEGMPWTNDNYYAWKGGIYSGGYGCAGFAFLLSDAAFGDLPARVVEDHSDVENIIRVGDIIRVPGHSVIVLQVEKDGVVLAEGNYNSSIHWGRKMDFSYIEKTAQYIITRYPD